MAGAKKPKHGFERRVQQRIRALRTGRDMSLTMLAAKAGISHDALSLIEKGERVPSLVTVGALARALDCTVAELFGEKEPDWSAAVYATARLLQEQRPEVQEGAAKLIKVFVETLGR